MIRDNRELARHIISTANRITGAERGAIFLLEKDARTLKPTLRAATNLNEGDVKHPDFEESMKMIIKRLHPMRGSFQAGTQRKILTTRTGIPSETASVYP